MSAVTLSWCRQAQAFAQEDRSVTCQTWDAHTVFVLFVPLYEAHALDSAHAFGPHHTASLGITPGVGSGNCRLTVLLASAP